MLNIVWTPLRLYLVPLIFPLTSVKAVNGGKSKPRLRFGLIPKPNRSFLLQRSTNLPRFIKKTPSSSFRVILPAVRKKHNLSPHKSCPMTDCISNYWFLFPCLARKNLTGRARSPWPQPHPTLLGRYVMLHCAASKLYCTKKKKSSHVAEWEQIAAAGVSPTSRTPGGWVAATAGCTGLIMGVNWRKQAVSGERFTEPT